MHIYTFPAHILWQWIDDLWCSRILQFINTHYGQVGDKKRSPGTGGAGALLVCCREARTFPHRELICPRHVIKMEVCFDKDTLGHYFPTQLVRPWLFEETSRKNDTWKQWECVNVHQGSAYVTIKPYRGVIIYMKRPRNQRRNHLPVQFSRVNISGSDARRVRPCCCPTLSFHVAFPINSLPYVCTLPLLSIPTRLRVVLLWYEDVLLFFMVILCHCCNPSDFVSRLFVHSRFF